MSVPQKLAGLLVVPVHNIRHLFERGLIMVKIVRIILEIIWYMNTVNLSMSDCE